MYSLEGLLDKADNWTTSASAPRTIWDASPTQWGQDWTRQSYCTPTGVKISDVNDFEASAWWDKSVRDHHLRPGPGMLPTLLVEKVLDHLLLKVDVAYPVAPPHYTSWTIESGYEPPSLADVQGAIPHPHAYYCRQRNDWVILQWTDSHLNPLPHIRDGLLHPLPSEYRRLAVQDCLTTSRYSEHANKTHHFHFYGSAVSTTELDPPYSTHPWQTASSSNVPEERNQAVHGEPMDIYICCGCSHYVLVGTKAIPGVIPPELIAALVKDRVENPLPEVPWSASVVIAFEFLIRWARLCVAPISAKHFLACSTTPFGVETFEC